MSFRWLYLNKKFVILGFGLLLLYGGCFFRRPDSNILYHDARPFFGTIVQVDVCAPSQEKERIAQTYRRIWARMGEIHQRLNIFDPQSELSALNRSFPNFFEASPELFQLIERSVQYRQITDGAFDITGGVLSNVWKDAEKNKRIPTEISLNQALRFVGADKIGLGPGREITLAHADVSIDLGGLAAGYAADEASRILREEGLSNFYVNMGGEIYVEGHNCLAQDWHIGVQNPDIKGEVLEVLALRNQAVSTSGSYERVYHIQGQRFSRILNPKTGYPVPEIISATVVAPTAEQADAFSTALCLFSPKDAISFIEKQGEGFAAMVLTRGIKGRIIRHESFSYSRLKAKK